MKNANKFHIIWIIFLISFACRKPYEPAIIQANHNFLVVEGILNANNDAITTISLSRTRNITDSVFTIPELNAQVSIEAKGGSQYFLNNGGNGIYTSLQLRLNVNEEYRLNIRTNDGLQYLSDFVPVKQTAPIDSLTWEYPSDVNIYVNSHDPTGTSRYYRWDYTETWEYHSFFDSNLGYKNGQIYFKDSSEMLTACWDSAHSTNIVLGSSVALSEDIINHKRVVVVPHGSEKIDFKYSVLVRQYALTQKAFQYWELLEKTSEELGSFFDAQPAQLIGNIRCVTNPDQPVIGYISASTVQEKRIFIRRTELPFWDNFNTGAGCDPIIIATDDAQSYLNGPTYAPAYYVGVGGFLLAIARSECVDCRLKGGTTERPLFWR